MSALGVAIFCGMLVSFGGFAVILGLRRRTIRLSDALAALDSRAVEAEATTNFQAHGLEAMARFLQRRLRLPITKSQQQLLLLQDRSVGDFFAEKLVFAVTGFCLPALWLTTQYLLGEGLSPLPLIWGLAGAVIGYYLADWRLAKNAGSARASVVESVHTFFDLVALERLANASATQAVSSAAGISDAPLFRRISLSMERARMEQVPPWDEIKQIATQWKLPELTDFADVMKLEAQGAALAEALQARVKELRDAHLSDSRAKAQEVTEGLAIWMTLPALLLGVAFITPALLKLMT